MFRSLGVDHRKADVERTCTVVRSQPLLLQTLDELQRQTLDDDVAFAPEESAWAAISPAGPAPTTRTSTSARTGIRRAGSSICFIFGIG